jgi:hypothetical protein
MSSASPATPSTSAGAGSNRSSTATAAARTIRSTGAGPHPPRGGDLLTDKQQQRLQTLFADDSHVQVEATWGHLPAHDHRLPADRVQARQPMVRLIDSLSHGVPKPLSELITLGHIEESGRRRIGLLRPARCQQRTHRGDQWPAPRPPLLGARISQGSPTADHGSRRRLRRRRPRCRRG